MTYLPMIVFGMINIGGGIMNKNMTYTIKFANTTENLEVFNWISKQNDSDEFIINVLKDAMKESNGGILLSREELEDISNLFSNTKVKKEKRRCKDIEKIFNDSFWN